MLRNVLLLAILIGVLSGGVLLYRKNSREVGQTASLASPTLLASPDITVSPHISQPPSFVPSPVATLTKKIASKIQLAVPFTVQAPDAEWVEPWKEGCEEAALIMVDQYFKGNTLERLPAAETKKQISQMVDWQIERFGSHKNLTIEEMAIVAKDYLGYKSVVVKENATAEDIRSFLREGKPVIIPAAGRSLNNPYFTQPGPLYHVFVITGFDGADTFIANENGTKRGHNYRYSAATIQKAWHDWREGEDVASTPNALLVLSQ